MAHLDANGHIVYWPDRPSDTAPERFKIPRQRQPWMDAPAEK